MRLVTDFFDPVDGAAESLGVALELNKYRPTLLLLSGGSALEVPNRLPASVFSSNLTIAMLDERWSTDLTVNNFAQLMATGFYERRKVAGATFFDSRPKTGESASDLAARFDSFLHAWRGENADGVIIATLGMGVDGHTAGIFPGFVERLGVDEEWVKAYEVPLTLNPYTDRVTVTPQFLTANVDRAVALVAGAAKKSVLAEVMDEAASPETYPAMLWHRMPNVTVVTDNDLY